jgi:hypothetical protein
MVSLNLYGQFKEEMQPSQITISLLILTESEHKYILMNLQVETKKDRKNNLDISMEAVMLPPQMDLEHQAYQE